MNDEYAFLRVPLSCWTSCPCKVLTRSHEKQRKGLHERIVLFDLGQAGLDGTVQERVKSLAKCLSNARIQCRRASAVVKSWEVFTPQSHIGQSVERYRQLIVSVVGASTKPCASL